jgi:hypothetical protein
MRLILTLTAYSVLVLIFRHLVGVVAPDSRATIDQELTTRTRLMEKIGATDPQQVATAATRVAQLVE